MKKYRNSSAGQKTVANFKRGTRRGKFHFVKIYVIRLKFRYFFYKTPPQKIAKSDNFSYENFFLQILKFINTCLICRVWYLVRRR